MEFPNKHFCSEGREHRFVEVDGERTCNECGLVSGPTHYVAEYGCWDRAIMKRPYKEATTYSKVVGFIKRKGVILYDLFGERSFEVINEIVLICDAEKPRGKRLPNLNILSYQVCKWLGVEIDKTLLKGLVSHQEFAGSNSCWRPFFGTNRLDDLESVYNPSYI